MEKSYDLILNMAGNPGLSLGNLKTVGLTADNTALESEEKYLNSQKIQNMAMFKDDMGNFSKTKFHDFYQTAKNVYNVMSSDQYTDDLAKKSRVYILCWLLKESTRLELIHYSPLCNEERHYHGMK